jgi:hypothetical protein
MIKKTVQTITQTKTNVKRQFSGRFFVAFHPEMGLTSPNW